MSSANFVEEESPMAHSTADILFKPLQLGPQLTVKNRILRSNVSGRFDNEDGSITQARINWETKFARGGVGAILGSYAPVSLDGRIMAGYAGIHRDDFIPQWERLGAAVHAFDCKYVMQLSHSGRQMDVPGIYNDRRPAPAATSAREPIHGFKARAMSGAEIETLIKQFARAAWRSREAGLDGVELHASNGYLFNQFLSSGINDRLDEWGGDLTGRARFLLEVIKAIRGAVGPSFQLQVKLGAIDYNNVDPFEKAGNTLADAVQVAQWCEAAGVHALHVSIGSSFPHPLNPPGDMPVDELARVYTAVAPYGDHGWRNWTTFRFRALRPFFRWVWFRQQKGRRVEGVSLDEARAIKAAVKIPVISTGGYQTASYIREAISSGACDAVSIARPLIANNDLIAQWQQGRDVPERPCTYCNRCLVNAPKNLLGCYDESRFASRAAMVEEILSVYEPRPTLVLPEQARSGLRAAE
jgi:2,4-dienoyl-CoA reductase-like NADH-dependent reductase (Old Yellow Enzyme family)